MSLRGCHGCSWKEHSLRSRKGRGAWDEKMLSVTTSPSSLSLCQMCTVDLQSGKGGLCFQVPCCMCSSTESALLAMRFKLCIALSLGAKESKPALDKRLGFTQLDGCQHGSQVAVYVKWGRFQLLSHSVEGKCMPPGSLINSILNQRKRRISLQKIPFQQCKRMWRGFILECQRGKRLHWVRKNSVCCFPKWPTLIFSQDWWSCERPVCCDVWMLTL